MTHAFLEALHRSGILRCARLGSGRHLVVLNFHRVCDIASDFHDGMIELSSARFREQIAWLSRNAEFISEADLEGLRPGRRPKVLLTFDDGYSDAHTVIAPILEEYKTGAIFFVAPGLIDRRVLGAWDRIAYLVKRYHGGDFRFRGKSFPAGGDRRALYLQLAQWNRDSLPERGDEFVAELATALGVPPPDRAAQSEELLTWDQVRDLQRRGFAIGCHSFSHRVLSSLPVPEQEEEILLARARLTSEQVPARSFAYPYGSPLTYSWETRQAVLRAGFRYVFSFSGQTERVGAMDPTRIDRVAFKSSLAKYDFLLSLPTLHDVAHFVRSGREA